MSYEQKKYIRKVVIATTYYEIISTTDELAYIDKSPSKINQLGKFQVGLPTINVVEEWRKVTEPEEHIFKGRYEAEVGIG